MKAIIWTMLLAVAHLSAVFANTIYCPSCSQDDFENAYYHQSQPGDTIVLPAGAATWGNSSRFNAGIIYIITNVTVIGQGDSTVITLDDSGAIYSNGVIACWAAATFSNFKIVGSNVNPVTAFSIKSYNNPTTGINFTGGFRLNRITYVGGTAGAQFCSIGAWVNYGVIDHCNLTGNSGQAELIFGYGETDAWQISNTLGGANNIFIENNSFGSPGGYVCDANANARFVVRYNTMNGRFTKVDGHGFYSNTPPHAFRNMEVYGNHWTETSLSWTAIEIRGSTAMVFNNTADVTDPNAAYFYLTDYGYEAPAANFGVGGTSTAGSPTTITTTIPHGYSTGWPVWVQAPYGDGTNNIYGFYNITVTGPNTFTIPFASTVSGTIDYATRLQTPYDYPIREQVGVGTFPTTAASAPAYVWNNTKSGGSSPWPRSFHIPSAGAIALYQAQTGNSTATFAEADVIKSNRDFFADSGFDTNTGVSVGTTAQMNAMTPTVVGYGFWVTDQGNWNASQPGTSGLLYAWTGSAWVLKYTPYLYPHPATRPPAPTNLRMTK